MCVCKEQAVKSKQNRIIQQFQNKPEVFDIFFIKMMDISVRGKENPIIECSGQILKPYEID